MARKMLETHWNIDDLEIGKLYVVEHHDIRAHRWDEDTETLYRFVERVKQGSVLLLVDSHKTIKWEEHTRSDFYTTNPSSVSGTFHTFVIGEKVLLLERTSLYVLEPSKFSKTVQTPSQS